MDMNSYLVEWLANERLGELRGALARERLVASLGTRSSPRLRLGATLIGLGRRLQGDRPGVASRAAGTVVAH
jgi:hypothetical protein